MLTMYWCCLLKSLLWFWYWSICCCWSIRFVMTLMLIAATYIEWWPGQQRLLPKQYERYRQSAETGHCRLLIQEYWKALRSPWDNDQIRQVIFIEWWCSNIPSLYIAVSPLPSQLCHFNSSPDAIFRIKINIIERVADGRWWWVL